MRRASRIARDALTTLCTESIAIASSSASSVTAARATTTNQLVIQSLRCDRLGFFAPTIASTHRATSYRSYGSKRKPATMRPMSLAEMETTRIVPGVPEGMNSSMPPIDGVLYGSPPSTWEERERETLESGSADAASLRDEDAKIDAMFEVFMKEGIVPGSGLPTMEEIMEGRERGAEGSEVDGGEAAPSEDADEDGEDADEDDENAPIVRVPIRDSRGWSYGTGKRKTAIARVWLAPGGEGAHRVNGKPYDEYFPSPSTRGDMLSPFFVTDTLGLFSATVDVRGGGITGQCQAIRHGISKALQNYDPVFRPALKEAGFLRRDSRIVERKKPGKAKARKSFAWVKR